MNPIPDDPNWHPDAETPLAPPEQRDGQQTLAEALAAIGADQPSYTADVFVLYVYGVDPTWVAKDLQRFGISGCTVYAYDAGAVIEVGTRELHEKLKSVYHDAKENPFYG